MRKIKASVIALLLLFAYLLLLYGVKLLSFNLLTVKKYIISSLVPIVIVYFICTFISALSEELMFKGMLFRGLKEETNLKFIIIAIIVSVFFSLWHTCYYGTPGMITTFVFQLISIIIFQYYPSLWLTTGMHFVINVIIHLVAETQ